MEALTLLNAAIDLVLAGGLLVLAGWALASPNLFRAVVLFVLFGLFMSLVWIRLNAPDVAMAEAAIGAGISGALLMSAVARLRELHSAEQEPDRDAD